MLSRHKIKNPQILVEKWSKPGKEHLEKRNAMFIKHKNKISIS